MRRRDFVMLSGGAAIAPILAARPACAQPKPVVGFLNARSPADSKHTVAAFHHGLAEYGFVDGQNVTVEFRWASGQYERLPALAAELVRLPVNVLTATGGAPSALAAKAATSVIPVVFGIGSDPVKAGLVASYSRPGGNVTGVNILTRTLESKRIGLLREVVPRASIIGFLINLTGPGADQQLADAENAVRGTGVKLRVLRASSNQQIDAAFETIARERIPALVVGADAFYDTRRAKLVELAAKHAVPTVYQFREFAAAGGLMSYGIDLPDVYRHVGSYAGRILKGAKPADLPVLQPTKFEFVLNQKTAKALNLELTPNVLSLADEVIE
jgi:putative ABC transport system substrate-binding protein